MSVVVIVLVPVLLVLLLVVRSLTLAPLVWLQRATRQQAAAAVGAGAPAGRRPFVVASALGLGCAAGVEALLFLGDVRGLRMLRAPIDPSDGPRLLVQASHVPLHTAELWYLVPAISALVLWLLFWFLTQRNLLTIRMPARVWSARTTRRRVFGLLALRAVLGVFLLPYWLIFAVLLFQIGATVTSRRHEPVVARADAAPAVVPAVVPTAPVPGPVAATPVPQPYVPTQFAPPVPPVPQAPPIGKPLSPHDARTIGGYQLLGRIGSGGMGTVYLAQRQGSATQVALKTINLELLHDAELLRRFQRESEVLAMVPGAYTARVLDTGVDAGRPYLAMELLDGRPLDVHLREQGPIRSAEALRALALALAVALSGVHRLGLVHRDLKPANIMLTSAGPRLLDFGIAAIVDGTRLTATGGGPGTLTYMAPEQFGDGRVGTAADIWAWACCVVCAAHGASPFAATNTGAVIRRIVDTGPEPAALAAVQALDPALAAVVTHALANDPAQRPADGTGLLAALAAAQATPPDPTAVHDQITRGWQTLAL
ncbi:serine/threonine protein kinase [Streptomyces sp. 1114.5]|nr:serine/threonine-protein kinase [Streptomyces sp. 1114.5]RKT11162.1 serine/threonine protein kinase [Streptomyces sp. 1114.5]